MGIGENVEPFLEQFQKQIFTLAAWSFCDVRYLVFRSIAELRIENR